MIIIKRFIDKVSAQQGKQGTNVVLSIEEARMLCNELTKLLADNYELLNSKKDSLDETVIHVELNGGKW